MKTVIMTATLLASLGATGLAVPALAATSHEAPGHHAEYRLSPSNDPAPRWAAHLGCTIAGSYLGEPYCFGGDQLGWSEPGWRQAHVYHAGGNRFESRTY